MNASFLIDGPLCVRWIGAMGHFLWQGAVLFLLAAGVAALLRRAPSRYRYGVWVTALLLMAACPFVTFVFLGRNAEPTVRMTMLARAAPDVRVASDGFGETHASASASLLPGAEPIEPSAPTDTATMSIVSARPATLDAPASPSLHWQAFAPHATVGYGLGVLLMVTRLVFAFGGGRRLRRRSWPVTDPALLAALRRQVEAMGLSFTPAVAYCRQVLVPTVIGVIRPTILLPLSLTTGLSPEQIEMLLAHELAHLRRYDHLVNLAQRLIEAFLFFHPAVWFVSRRIGLVREQCCDECVVATGARPLPYAASLVEMAALASKAGAGRPLTVSAAALGAVSSPSALRGRIQRLLGEPVHPRVRLQWHWSLLLILVAAIGLGGVAGLSADAERADDTPTSTVSSPTSSPASAPAAQDPPFVARGVLSGRITDHRNRPVTDATVTLSGPQTLQTATDADGVYRFETIEQAGHYWVHVRSPLWLGDQRSADAPVIELQAGESTVRHFRVSPGEFGTVPTAYRVDVTVLDEAGEPMQGVSLTASPVRAVRRFREAKARTGPHGRSRIVDIHPAGTVYLITALKESYAPASVVVGFDRFDEVPSRTVTLRKGVTVRGRALCLDGKPATGWAMYALPDWWSGGFSPEDAEIDEDGFFTLRNIVPGRYNLQVSIPHAGGGTRFNVLTAKLPPSEGVINVTIPRSSPQSAGLISGTVTFLGGTPRSSVEASARSAGGEFHHAWVMPRLGDPSDKVTFEIGPLPPGLYTVQFSSPLIENKVVRGIRAPAQGLNVELVHTGRPMLRGEVVEAGTGRPVTWFRARVRKVDESGYGQDSEWRTFESDKGRFQIETIGQGVYDVQVAAPGFAWAVSREIDTKTDKAAVPIKLNVAEILRGPLVDEGAVRIELNAGVTLRGRVVDEAGQPISGAKVIPLSWGGGTTSRTRKRFASEDEFVTTIDGVFTIEHLAPGAESLKVRHPDYCFAIVNGIEVAAGRVTDGPTITLTRGGTVRGHVYDVDGKPAPNVMLYFQDEMGPGDLETGVFATALTDADGRYEVRHLPAQFCYVEHDYRRPLLGVVRRGVLVKNGQTRTIDLGGTPVISGRLVVNGEPLNGARVLLCGADVHFSVFWNFGYTEADGSFTFRGVPPGVRHIYYDLGGTRSAFVSARTVRVADRDIDLGVVSLTTGTVTVQLEAEDGDEVPPDVRLGLQRYNAKTSWGRSGSRLRARTESNEPFVFESVLPGEYEVVASRQGYPALRRRVTLEPGQMETTITMPLEWGTAVVQGRVDPNLHTRGGVGALFFWHERGHLAAMVNANSGDRYKIEHLPAGTYEVKNAYDRRGEPTFTFTLADGETKTLDLDERVYPLSPTAARARGLLRVAVLGEDGIVLPGAEVYLTRDTMRLDSSHDSDRGILFAGRAGDYTLHAAYPGFRPASRTVQLQSQPPTGRNLMPPIMMIELSRN